MSSLWRIDYVVIDADDLKRFDLIPPVFSAGKYKVFKLEDVREYMAK